MNKFEENISLVNRFHFILVEAKHKKICKLVSSNFRSHLQALGNCLTHKFDQLDQNKLNFDQLKSVQEYVIGSLLGDSRGYTQ
jgi:hypothetical protein